MPRAASRILSISTVVSRCENADAPARALGSPSLYCSSGRINLRDTRAVTIIARTAAIFRRSTDVSR